LVKKRPQPQAITSFDDASNDREAQKKKKRSSHQPFKSTSIMCTHILIVGIKKKMHFCQQHTPLTPVLYILMYVLYVFTEENLQ